MRIAFFADSYLPYLSGVTVSIETLRRTFVQNGHEVAVFAPGYPSTGPEEGVFRFPSFRIPHVPAFRAAIPWSAQNWQTLHAWRPHIIHAHSPFQMGIAALEAARQLKVPIVYTMHTFFNHYTHYVPLLGLDIGQQMLSQWVCFFSNQCQAVVVPSHAARQWLLQLGVSRAIHVVPTGVDGEEVAAASADGIRAEFGVPAQVPLLVTVGRLAPEKNIAFLLDAFQKVSADHPGAMFLVVAHGPDLELLRQRAADLGVSRAVVWAGGMDRPKVLRCLKAADLFVFASKTETQGLVISEAQACGLPVVALRARGVSEMVEEGKDGYLLPEESALFARTIAHLLGDGDERRRLGAAGRQKILSRYSLAPFGRRVEEIYRSVI